MNFLKIVQRLASESGASGTVVTVTNPTGETQRLVNWAAQAWIEIQEIHSDWQWMRKTASFQTVPQKAIYTPAEAGAPDFATIALRTGRLYPTAAGSRGELFLGDIDYDDWRNQYQFGAYRTSYSQPTCITVTPDKSIGLGQTPGNVIYTVGFDYYHTPTDLLADADTPAMPERFHLAIVYRALIQYGLYEASPEAIKRGEDGQRSMLRRLEADQLPAMSFGGALV